MAQKEVHLLELSRYVCLTRRARIVVAPEQWPWGSYAAMMGNHPPPWLAANWPLGQFSALRPAAQRAYGRFVM